MATYIAFLRAINLGPTRKFPKDAIKAAVEAAGGDRVETYINTGNVRLDSSMRSRARLEAALEEAFLADRGFEVPTIVFTPAELREIAEDAKRFADGHEGRHYVSLLKEEPPAARGRAGRGGRDGRRGGPRRRARRTPPAGAGLPRGDADQRRHREAPRRRDEPQPDTSCARWPSAGVPDSAA